jgi:hypothetical protein
MYINMSEEKSDNNPNPIPAVGDTASEAGPTRADSWPEEQPCHGANGQAPPARAVSDRKLAANRENAKRSTGPKTAEGKEASSRNSYKHGIFSNCLIRQGPLEQPDSELFDTTLSAIQTHYQPEGFIEQLLVEKITAETIRFRRLLTFEQIELSRRSAFFGAGVDRVLRYQATINRQLFQAMDQLDRLQAKRKAELVRSDPGSFVHGHSGEAEAD